jgi:hypothetical protein
VGRALHELADAFDPAVIDARAAAISSSAASSDCPRAACSAPVSAAAGRASPLSQSDYIFPSLGEELGLIGVFAILCLYMVFTSRGIRIGIAGQDDFGKLLATGLSFTIALQVFIMVGGVTRSSRSRAHDAVPRGGRIVAHRELDHRRAAASHLRCRALAPRVVIG